MHRITTPLLILSVNDKAPYTNAPGGGSGSAGICVRATELTGLPSAFTCFNSITDEVGFHRNALHHHDGIPDAQPHSGSVYNILRGFRSKEQMEASNEYQDATTIQQSGLVPNTKQHKHQSQAGQLSWQN